MKKGTLVVLAFSALLLISVAFALAEENNTVVNNTPVDNAVVNNTVVSNPPVSQGNGRAAGLMNASNRPIMNASNRPLVNANPLSNFSRNMTYGKCVSELAKQQNTCVKAVTNASKICDRDKNMDKNRTKACKETFKNSAERCKTLYKDTKAVCKNFKKTFWDKVRFWK